MQLILSLLFLLFSNQVFAMDGDIHGWLQATDITASGSFIGDGSQLTSLPVPTITPFTASHSIVSACNANGWQISTSKPAMASYTVNVATTAAIGGAVNGAIILKTSATNSSIAGDWVESGRIANSQAITLAIVLQSAQNVTAPIFAMVPAGYYLCLQSATTSGNPSYSYLSGQETIIG